MSVPTVAVIGGGIAGLVSARALAAACEVTLFESSTSLGGKIVSVELNEMPIDIGPDAFITRQTAGERLCRELGLADDLLPPSSNSVAIFTKGELHRMPSGVVLGIPTDLRALRESEVVSRRAALRALLDLVAVRPITLPGALARAESGEDDPSVEEIFGPRLGGEILKTLIDPLLGGINASDVGSLSLAACAPQLLSRIEGRRSVMRSLRAEPATFTPGPSRPPFLGLRAGMASLPAALETACRAASVTIFCNQEVLSIVREPDDRWKLTTATNSYVVDGVLLSTPASVAARLLVNVAPAVSEELAAIPYASVVTACYSFPADAISSDVTARLRQVVPSAPVTNSPLIGSGVLVPRDGKHLITGVTFTSSKWPRSAAPGEIVVRAFAGRHHDERAIQMDDTELHRALLADLAGLLGITAPPTASVVKRWENALPQYVTGHLARTRRIDEHLLAAPTLALAGAAYHGIGIPACIEDAERAAARLISSLAN